jgi:hypothetical protein
MDEAVRVTTVPLGYEAWALAHNRPQLMPAGVLVTVPRIRPNGVLTTSRVKLWRSNRAATFRAASIATLHAPPPLQAPDQPTKSDPALGRAVKVTVVPIG